MKHKCAAIVLAAGQGKRMNATVAKQYLQLGGKPVLYYCLEAFQKSFVDEIILVTGEDDIEYCRREIVEPYGFHKVTSITAGGRERFHSVYAGLLMLSDCSYVFIHDGARPFLNEEIIHRTYEGAKAYDACIAGMPVKDTVKIADENAFAAETPLRNLVWSIQTPQVFSYPLIRKAYECLMEKEVQLAERGVFVTDDAMVVEYFTDKKVKLVQGGYGNIKITTPEDLEIASLFLEKQRVHDVK